MRSVFSRQFGDKHAKLFGRADGNGRGGNAASHQRCPGQLLRDDAIQKLDYYGLARRVCVDLGKFDDARRCIGEAMTEITKERWYEAEINRVAGEIALMSREPDAAKAQAYFERALELRA